jgi:hypothetical protein
MNYDASPEPRPAIDPALYERLIAEGIADADRGGRAIYHAPLPLLSFSPLSPPRAAAAR